MSRFLILTFHVLGRKGTGKQEKDSIYFYILLSNIFKIVFTRFNSFLCCLFVNFPVIKKCNYKVQKTCLPRFICFYISVFSRINFSLPLKELIANCRQICLPRSVSFSSCSSRIHFSILEKIKKKKKKKRINEKQIVALPIRS